MTGPRPLFLLTRSYPFGFGEEFLEAEIVHLAKAFEPVVVFPLAAVGAPRPLPGNVVVEDGIARREAGLTRRLARTALAPVRTTAFVRELCRWAPRTLHPSGLQRLLTETRRAVATRDVLRRAVARHRLAARAPVLYSYWFTGQTVGAILARLACGNGPVVTRTHGFDLHEELYRPRYIPFRAWSMARITRVFPVSNHGAARLAARFPLERRKITASPLGVPDPGASSRPSADGAFRILSCSNCIPLKRLDLLARGVAAFAEGRRGRVLWTHVGDGPTRPGIEAIARTEFPPHATLSTAGRLTHDRVLDVYRREAIDLFVTVSASEGGIPVSIMEAMSFGVPVLATAIGGIPEIVDPSTGWILDPVPSVEAVADGLRRAADADPSERDPRRNAAHARWKERFDADRNFAAFAEELRLLPGSAGSGARP